MSENMEKPSAVVESTMSECVSLRDDLATVAGPRAWCDTRESWLSRAARRCGVSYRTAKSIWYGETDDPRSSIAQRIRSAAAIEKARRARLADADRLESVAAALEARDENFYRGEIESYRSMAAQLRDMVRDRSLAKAAAEN